MTRFHVLTRPLREADRTNAWTIHATRDDYAQAAAVMAEIDGRETRTIDEQFRAGDAIETQICADSALPANTFDRNTTAATRTNEALERYGGLGKVRALLRGEPM